jgi:hypothetical protein
MDLKFEIQRFLDSKHALMSDLIQQNGIIHLRRQLSSKKSELHEVCPKISRSLIFLAH